MPIMETTGGPTVTSEIAGPSGTWPLTGLNSATPTLPGNLQAPANASRTDGQVRNFAAGDIILREGEPGDAAYLVLDGEVEVMLQDRDSGENRVIGNITAPGIFGEMALIDRSPRLATVRARCQTSCLIITESVLGHALERTEPMVRALVHALVRRLRGVTVAGTLAQPDGPLRGLTVCVVAYDEMSMTRMKAALVPTGAEIVPLRSGVALLSKLQSGLCPALLVTDYRTADVDAPLLAKSVRIQADVARFPIAVLACASQVEQLTAARLSDVDAIWAHGMTDTEFAERCTRLALQPPVIATSTLPRTANGLH